MAEMPQARNVISVTWKTFQRLHDLRAKLITERRNQVSMNDVIQYLLGAVDE